MKMSIVSKILFSFIGLCLFLDYQANAQSQAASSKSPISNATKLELAKQVMHHYQMDKTIEMALAKSDFYFKKNDTIINNSQNKKTKQIYQDYLKKIEESKTQKKEKIVSEVQIQLINQFTEQELKYLIDIAKYEVFNKFKNYLDSDAYNKTIYRTFSENKDLYEDFKKKIAPESDNKIQNEKKNEK